MKAFFVFFLLFFFLGLNISYALESCVDQPSWKTAQYSLNYCNSACGYTGLPCVQQDTLCANYCAGTCCSYCVCDPCGETSPSPAEQCGGSELNVVHDSDPLSTSSCEFHCKCPGYAGQPGYDFETCSVPEDGDPCADQAADALAACGSSDNVDWYFPSQCLWQCKPSCQDQNPTPEEECGELNNVRWIEVSTCSWECKCPDYSPSLLQGDPPQCGGYDLQTCQCIPLDTPCSVFEFNSECPLGHLSKNWETCDYVCKTCQTAQDACENECPGGGTQTNCIDGVGGNIGVCVCDDGSPAGPEPDPDDLGDDPGDGKSPDPDDDPDNQKTCSDYEAECPPSCQFACSSDPDTGKALRPSCDCSKDPADPGPDGIPGTEDDGAPGSADDGSNGWLKQIEDNTDKTAEGVSDSNGWLKAIKSNSDESLEDTDNIAENTRRSLENDQKYFSSSDRSVFKDKYNDSVFNDSEGESVYVDKYGESVFKDLDGKSYLQRISDNLEEIETSGSGDVPENNVYSSSFSGDGIDLLPEDSFSQGLADYIATGIPLVAWVKDSSINLSSASSVISFSLWGHSADIDFSPYEGAINLAGNILFALSLLASFMLIIRRK